MRKRQKKGRIRNSKFPLFQHNELSFSRILLELQRECVIYFFHNEIKEIVNACVHNLFVPNLGEFLTSHTEKVVSIPKNVDSIPEIVDFFAL